MPELTVVMPVYNEEGAIVAVLTQWAEALNELAINYRIAVYNDGSKDATLAVLRGIVPSVLCGVAVIDQANRGHGPTILRGYRDHPDSTWIFQIDSDGELGPEKFAELWAHRQGYDFLIGNRIERCSPLPRRLTTWVSRGLVWLMYGRAVFDVNCPYRLFKPASFQGYLRMIPEDTFAPNLILAGMASCLRLKVYQTDVIHSSRQTGEVSIKKWRLFKAAVRSCLQTAAFRLRMIDSSH